MGDASDNIPGVEGIGEKMAKKLLAEYQTCQGVYENIDKIGGKLQEKLKKDEKSAKMSYILATIDTNVDIDCSLEECAFTLPFSKEVFSIFEKYEFSSLTRRKELFDTTESKPKAIAIETKPLSNLDELKGNIFAFYEFENKLFVATNEKINFEYQGNIEDFLLLT